MQSDLIFETPVVTSEPPSTATYQSLEVLQEENVLAEPGLVTLRLPTQPETWDAFAPVEEGTRDYPPSVEDTDVADRIITWIRIRPRVGDDETRTLFVDADEVDEFSGSKTALGGAIADRIAVTVRD